MLTTKRKFACRLDLATDAVTNEKHVDSTRLERAALRMSLFTTTKELPLLDNLPEALIRHCDSCNLLFEQSMKTQFSLSVTEIVSRTSYSQTA